MVESGYITRAEAPPQTRAAGCQAQRVYSSVASRTSSTTSQQLPKLTASRRRQRRAQGLHDDQPPDAARRAQRDPRPPAGGPVLGDPGASLVAIDPTTGDIVALQNSTTYGTQTTFDYATQAQRQTGSSFKPFVLMTMINDDDGDPNQTYYVSKFLPKGWLPGSDLFGPDRRAELPGHDQRHQGDGVSDNTVYAQLGVDVGWRTSTRPPTRWASPRRWTGTRPRRSAACTSASRRCRCPTPTRRSPTAATTSPRRSSPRSRRTARRHHTGHPQKTQVFSHGEAYAATQTLETACHYGTGTGAYYGCPAAGKTGTTSNYNAWFVGYTPKLSTAVWVGYPQRLHDDVNDPATAARSRRRSGSSSCSRPLGYCDDFTPPAPVLARRTSASTRSRHPCVRPTTERRDTTTDHHERDHIHHRRRPGNPNQGGRPAATRAAHGGSQGGRPAQGAIRPLAAVRQRRHRILK